MKTWIAAAALAAIGVQAGAATIEFTFHSTDTSYENDELDIYEPHFGAYFDVLVRFDAPSLANLDIDVADLGVGEIMSLYDVPLSYFTLTTDSDGALTEVLGGYDNDEMIGASFGAKEAFFYDYFGADRYYFDGNAKLVNLDAPPVPLPAGAPLLIGGLAGLAALRRRSIARSRPHA